jgi:hypothetical protein
MMLPCKPASPQRKKWKNRDGRVATGQFSACRSQARRGWGSSWVLASAGRFRLHNGPPQRRYGGIDQSEDAGCPDSGRGPPEPAAPQESAARAQPIGPDHPGNSLLPRPSRQSAESGPACAHREPVRWSEVTLPRSLFSPPAAGSTRRTGMMPSSHPGLSRRQPGRPPSRLPRLPPEAVLAMLPVMVMVPVQARAAAEGPRPSSGPRSGGGRERQVCPFRGR